MKHSLLLAVLCLFTGLQAFAQDTIVTMTSKYKLVKIYAEWAGSGSITANGVELNNDFEFENEITTTADSSVVLTTTGDAQLTSLNCSNNLLTALDVTKCSELRELFCSLNALTVLDISKCTKLNVLACSENSLSALDVTKCTELKGLLFAFNSLTSIDVTNCTELTDLSCYNNSLTTLDVTNCPELTRLYCHKNYLTALDVTNCPELMSLYCNNNFLTTLDITNCPELEYLIAHNQTPVLPMANPDGDKLSIKNPITLIGAELRIGYLSDNGTYSGDNITWKVQGESGEVTFRFATKLPEGIKGEPFSGTVTQPWNSEMGI